MFYIFNMFLGEESLPIFFFFKHRALPIALTALEHCKYKLTKPTLNSQRSTCPL